MGVCNKQGANTSLAGAELWGLWGLVTYPTTPPTLAVHGGLPGRAPRGKMGLRGAAEACPGILLLGFPRSWSPSWQEGLCKAQAG